ncbi:MAG: BMP family ABC transporter substrate-binding protein [Lachnospiraceae bacterium]|nr:BMP family ABC transporter substrate-binding protein [Lachnospiraceae bacterium]
MKKMLAGILMLSALLLSACGSSKSASEMDDYVTNEGYAVNREAAGATEQSADTTASETKAGTKVIPLKDIKIGVLYIGSASETSGYTYTHELGIQGMVNNLGLDSSQVIRKENVDDGDEKAIDQALQECVDEGCNIIFATSWGYMELTNEYAEKYPDIYFAHCTGYMSNGKNFTNYFGRIYQARYLSGIVAGLKTSSNKIGYVAAQGSGNSEVTGGIDAFAIGVESVNPDAEIYVKVTNSWFDPEGERAAADALLAEGCDVLAQHCDTTAPQEAAQEKGVYSIGYNSDMSKETPKATLTSVIWTWSAYYTSYVQSIIDGSYDGSNYYEGISVGLVGLSELADFNDGQAAEKVSEAKKQITSGAFNVFDGELKTNDGKTIGESGKTLDDATITGGIDWYYQNVTVLD